MEFESIVVANSDDLSRIGMRAILAGSEILNPIVEVRNFQELMDVLGDVAGGILLIDAKLTGMGAADGACSQEALFSVSRRFPGFRICVLVDTVTREVVSQYLSIGVMGCVEKSRTVEEIVDAISAISDNRPYLSKLDENEAPSKLPIGIPGNLTHRQRKVLAVMATGKSNKEIARELGICEGTVKVHVNAAYRALGVHNRVAAVTILREMTERGAPANAFFEPLRAAVGSN